MEATQPLRGTLYLFLSLSYSLSLSLGDAEAFSEMEGSYSYTTSENYDDFLKERGVPWIGRKLIMAAPVQLEVGGILLNFNFILILMIPFNFIPVIDPFFRSLNKTICGP